MAGPWGVFLIMMVGVTKAQYFIINSGPCTVDPAAKNCIRSPNFPLDYGNGLTCVITPTALAIGNCMTATNFSTEACCDKLSLPNTARTLLPFSGTLLSNGPSNFVLGAGSIRGLRTVPIRLFIRAGECAQTRLRLRLRLLRRLRQLRLVRRRRCLVRRLRLVRRRRCLVRRLRHR